MKNLYETVDSLKNFTSLKEEIVKNEDPFITSIELCYNDNGGDYKIGLFAPIIKGFNKFDSIGYLIADLECYTSEEELFNFLISNEIIKIIVHFNDETVKEYYITWASIFDRVNDNVYIMIFETKNGEYYK